MVHLRATKRVLCRLPPATTGEGLPDNALGDWFVHRVVVDRQPLLLLLSSASLLPILEPARQVRSLPNRLPSIVERRLERLGVERALIAREIRAMGDVLVAPTNNRSVVGTMIDFGKAIPFYLPEGVRWGRRELLSAEKKLEGTPCRCSSRNTVFPVLAARDLLAARWIGGSRIVHPGTHLPQ